MWIAITTIILVTIGIYSIYKVITADDEKIGKRYQILTDYDGKYYVKYGGRFLWKRNNGDIDTYYGFHGRTKFNSIDEASLAIDRHKFQKNGGNND